LNEHVTNEEVFQRIVNLIVLIC